MHRAQGSLEYILIIGAVLAISATVILLATGAVGGQQSSVSINACKEAAAQCKAIHYSVPKDFCSQCSTACNVSGKEVFAGAVTCCKAGQSENIYVGSTGCQAYVPTGYCSDFITKYGECLSQKPTYCNYLGQFVNNCTYCQCPQGSQCNPTTKACGLVCTDGTSINSCSPTLPKYCNAAQSLVDNCTSCGCPPSVNGGQQLCDAATKVCYEGSKLTLITIPAQGSTLTVLNGSAFTITATVTCTAATGKNCGDVELTLLNDNNPIITLAGTTPLAASAPNPKPCSLMQTGQSCSNTWTVNANAPGSFSIVAKAHSSNSQVTEVSSGLGALIQL